MDFLCLCYKPFSLVLPQRWLVRSPLLFFGFFSPGLRGLLGPLRLPPSFLSLCFGRGIAKHFTISMSEQSSLGGSPLPPWVVVGAMHV